MSEPSNLPPGVQQSDCTRETAVCVECGEPLYGHSRYGACEFCLADYKQGIEHDDTVL